jgi:LysR family transcriptional regulator, glycine cleavage system transcriptional activator
VTIPQELSARSFQSSVFPENLTRFLFSVNSRHTDVFKHDVGQASKLPPGPVVGVPAVKSLSQSEVDFQGDGVDLAIRYGKGDYPGLETRFLMEESLVIVCHQSLVGDRKITKADLACLPWLIDESIDMHGSWLEFQNVLGIKIPDTAVKLSVTEASAQVEAVLAGRGMSLVRQSLVADMLASGLLIRPLDFSMPAEFHYYLVAPEAKFRTEKVRAFVSWISGRVGT